MSEMNSGIWIYITFIETKYDFGEVLIVGIVCVAVAIVSLVICTVHFYRGIQRERKLLRKLKDMLSGKFEESHPKGINPELALIEQVNSLPYNRKYEFPQENLILGQQLGSGAYGVVMKGIAKNILSNEIETTVAIKMPNPMANFEVCFFIIHKKFIWFSPITIEFYVLIQVIQALITELKIMVHLGKHLNVVNLLGAITINIEKR